MAKDQATLPGIEEGGIKEIEDIAYDYKKILNKRQDLTRREVELKTDLLAKMKKHGKRDYVHDEIEIHITTETEKVKVKIHDDEAEEEE